MDGQDVEFASERGGYYRLAFGGEKTRCIGYHASDKILEARVKALYLFMPVADPSRCITIRTIGDLCKDMLKYLNAAALEKLYYGERLDHQVRRNAS